VRAIVEPDAATRTELLAEAVETLESTAAPLELAKARADLGTALLRAGRRTDGRAALEPALDGAVRTGATALVERVRDEHLRSVYRKLDISSRSELGSELSDTRMRLEPVPAG
jgi:hypothetical protein